MNIPIEEQLVASSIGGTPSTPPTPPTPGQPKEPLNRLSGALKGSIGSFHDELNAFMKSPHLADSPKALEDLAHTIDQLHHLSQQAAAIDVK